MIFLWLLFTIAMAALVGFTFCAGMAADMWCAGEVSVWITVVLSACTAISVAVIFLIVAFM